MMRCSLFLLSYLVSWALVLPAQTPASSATHKKTTPEHTAAAVASAPGMKNFKESGSPNAPITIEVYSDFECPHCRNLFLETLPQLTAEYVNAGKVRLIHRDFPLPQHQYAGLATRFANAAGQIGRYDLVATQIFKTQAEWTQNGNIDAQVAKVLPPGEMQKVRELVKSDSHLDDSKNADVAMGMQDNLKETPTMEVVYKGKRDQISGFVPYNILKSYIDQKLAK